MPTALRFDALKAPAEEGARLVEPPADRATGLFDENRRLFQQVAGHDLGGITLGTLSSLGRRELIEAALQYTTAYRDFRPAIASADSLQEPLPRVLLAGHQPELFHPGVWLKNFGLSQLAARLDATPVNLVIDGDLARNTSIRVPRGPVQSPRIEAVAFAPRAPGVPWAGCRLQDRAQFASFADRVRDSLAPLVDDPLVTAFWPLAIERGRATGNVGAAISQARHQWEAGWGNQTLELPQSAVCRTRAFAWFAMHMLANLVDFRAAYNGALADYRLAHGLRSAAHPAPDLAEYDGWTETPFWVWNEEDPRRRPLYARLTSDRIDLSDQDRWTRSIVCRDRASLADGVEQLLALPAQGVSLHTRALTTTLFARLVLGDLFIHGIGGAKYDRVTDDLFRRFFDMTAPHYMAVSGTLRLPIDRPHPAPGAVAHWRQRQRELVFHPETFLDGEASDRSGADQAAIDRWIAQKREAIATPKTPASARGRDRTIREANVRLQPHLADERQRAEASLHAAQGTTRAESLLGARDFAACLYPSDRLKTFLTAEF